MPTSQAPILTPPTDPAALAYEPPPPAAGPVPPLNVAPPLGSLAARGFAWTVLNTVATKIVGLGSQIVLAWLLLGPDFGLAALTATVASFANLLRDAGLTQVLIHRQHKFHLWANSVFWLSLTLSAVSSLLTVAFAPLAARIFHEPGLVPLLWVSAAGGFLGGLAMLPTIRLQIDLRFGALSVVNAMMALATAALAVLLAWLGAGAYSLVVPLAATGALRAAVVWWLAPISLLPRPQARRWRHLWGDSTVLLATALAGMLISQGDYLALGLFHDAATVGLYFFAFGLSMQTIQLLTINITSVLFPALGRLGNDPSRQIDAFMNATRLIGAVGVPFCFLQAAAADPLMRLLYGQKWVEAIPLLQVLSLGTAATLVAGQTTSLLQAQGRFRTYLWCMVVFSIAFTGVFVASAAVGGALSVAVAVAGTHMVTNLLGMYVGVRPGGVGFSQVARLYFRTLCVGAAGVLPAALVVLAFPQTRTRPLLLLELVTIAGVGVCGSVLALRLLQPRVWGEMVARIRGLLGERSRTVASGFAS